MSKSVGTVMVVIGLSLLFVGFALPMVQAQGTYQVGTIEILNVPSSVTIGSTFTVNARAMLTDTNYPGSFSVKPYPLSSICWSGSANVSVPSSNWVNFSISVKAGWATPGSKALTLTGIRDYYTLNSSAAYVNVVEANQPTYYNLSVTTDGSGSVSPSSGSYLSGTAVSVTATPNSGYEFIQWSGDASGNSNPVSVTMTSNKNLVAHFAPASGTTTTPPTETVRLNTSSTPSSAGSVSTNPTGTTFQKGTAVVLTAFTYPGSQYVFEKWAGDVSGTENPKTIVMNTDLTVQAVFKLAQSSQFTLKLSVSPEGAGSVQATKTVANAGEVITVAAFPNEGWVFDSWSGSDASISSVLDVYMYGDKELVAHFSEDRGFLGTLSENIPYLLISVGALATVIGIAMIWRKR